jgi:hypothetical protein
MPSKTPKQARTMAAAAHDKGFAKKAGIPQSVARDFNQADAGGPMLKGGGKTAPTPPKKRK